MIDENLLENIRHTSLLNVVKMLGYSPKRESARYYRIKDSVLNLVIDTQRNMYSDNTSGNSGFGAVNFLVNLFGYNFKEAVSFLGGNISFSYSSSETISNTLQEKEKRLTPIPAPAGNLHRVIEYLTVKRKINKGIINYLISHKLLYADSYSNCVFSNLSKTYAFLRGTSDKRFVQNVGIMDFIVYSGLDKSDIYLFESLIDLLSFKTLFPDRKGVFVSINGSAMINQLFKLNLQGYNNVYCCFDNDEQGRKFDLKVKDLISAVKVIKSIKKDFNDDLVLKNNA